MNTKEKKCKSILSESKLDGIDYSINPYTGCLHSCKYCYASFMKRFTNHKEPWGQFVDIKTNAPEILKKQIKKKQPGNVLISSVTDPYQPPEKEYEITRKILQILSKTKMNVSVLTKNKMVIRDIDVFKKFKFGKISVGLTINYIEEKHKKIWEPGTSSIQERISALEKLYGSKIPTYIHIGPYLEDITDLTQVIETCNKYVYEIEIENINFNRKKNIMKTIRKYYPHLEKKYKKISKDTDTYNKKLKDSIAELRKKYQIPINLYIN